MNEGTVTLLIVGPALLIIGGAVYGVGKLFFQKGVQRGLIRLLAFAAFFLLGASFRF